MSKIYTTGRNERMDFYKGVLMFGVIWGHAITSLLAGSQNNVSIHWIMRTYDMPLFMLISGYFLGFSLKKRSLKELIKDKLTTIFFPAYIWGVIITYSYMLAFLSLYFLWAVFFSSLIIAFIAKTCANIKIGIIYVLIVTVLLQFIPDTLWNLSYLFPFFAIGYFINAFEIKPRRYLGGGGHFACFVYVTIELMDIRLLCVENWCIY